MARLKVNIAGLTRVLAIIAATALVMVGMPAWAAQSSVVEDPVGDAVVFESQTVAPAYQDIVEASVTLRDGRFAFTMEMAAPVPTEPALPPGAKLLEWSWRIHPDPTTFPSGFPFPDGLTAPAEFMVFVLWDGSGFTAILIDRTATLTGGETVITPVPLKIKETEITASVDAAMMGSPASFEWFANTAIWPAHLGSFSILPVDVAPDTPPFPTWSE